MKSRHMTLFILVIGFGFIFSSDGIAENEEIQADPYANSVVDYQVYGDNNTHTDPNLVVGVPCKGEQLDLSLGGGWVTVDMGSSEDVIDGQGADLRVYESEGSPYCNGGAASPYEVFVSESLDGPWISIGTGSGVSDFDISPSGLSRVRYIRVEDRSSGQPDDGSPTPGADIAGFEAIIDGFGFLDLPITYDNFEIDALGNTGSSAGKVNSWFDHLSPDYTENMTVTIWTGKEITHTNITMLNSSNCTSIERDACYNGHNGIDFQHDYAIKKEPIYPAATGVITEVHRTYPITGTRGISYGNYVLIDHRNKFATFYAHLASVNPAIDVGTEITATRPITIGIMGGTGGWSTHLHFGVYYDSNDDGRWTSDEVVDPYGWRGTDSDPWPNNISYGLWMHPLGVQDQVDNSGSVVTSSSGIYSVIIPPGSTSDPITLDVLVEPPVAVPSAQLRTIGRSFWLRVLEWLSMENVYVLTQINTNSFNIPITVTVSYTDTNLTHLDNSQLGIYLWSDTNRNWEKLSTTLDTSTNIASAQTIDIGHFDLQAPLLCPGDYFEVDDSYDASARLVTDETVYRRLFDIGEDEDWMKFDASGDTVYTFQTMNLVSGVDTYIELYDINGVTLLASDNDSGEGLASTIVWKAPASGTYFIRISQNPGSTYGCAASYEISVKGENLIYLPMTIR